MLHCGRCRAEILDFGGSIGGKREDRYRAETGLGERYVEELSDIRQLDYYSVTAADPALEQPHSQAVGPVVEFGVTDTDGAIDDRRMITVLLCQPS